MRVLNKFISWKKNIKPVEVYGLNAVFKLDSNFEKFKEALGNNIHDSIDDIILSNFIRENNFEKENLTYSDTFKSEIYSIVCEPAIGGTIYDRTLILSKNIRLKRKVKGVQVSSILSQYPNRLSNKILNIDPQNLYILINSNPKLTFWDNARNPIHYTYRRGINIYTDPVSRFLKVDISSRPGRIASLENFYFKGGFEYYFGNMAFAHINREKILSFPEAEEIKELDNNIIYVKLFNVNQYWDNFAQDRLSAFRKHLMIDELESRFLSNINKI